MSVSEGAGEGATFCTLGVNASWNWRGQSEVDCKFPSNCKMWHLQNMETFNRFNQKLSSDSIKMSGKGVRYRNARLGANACASSSSLMLLSAIIVSQ